MTHNSPLTFILLNCSLQVVSDEGIWANVRLLKCEMQEKFPARCQACCEGGCQAGVPLYRYGGGLRE